MMPIASVPMSQAGYRTVPEPIPAMCPPIGDPFVPQVNQFNHYQQAYSMPTPMPVSMGSSMATPVPIQHLHCQPQRLPHATITRTASPGYIARGRVTKACEHCKFRKAKCSGGEPCERCVDRRIGCVYEKRKPRGPSKKRAEMRDMPVRQVPASSSIVSVSLLSRVVASC